MKIVHITDLHITREGELIGGLGATERLDELVRQINGNHGDARMVVATGDLANWGDLESYERLKASLEKLSPPVALLIGNHDMLGNF